MAVHRIGVGPRIHPTAVVDDRATLGEDVEIGPFAVVGADVRLDVGVRIGPHVVLDGHTYLAPRVVVHAGSVIGGPPQDLKYDGADTGVEIGAGTIVREHVTVNRACQPGGITRVGRGVLLMAYCHVAHDCAVGDGVRMANGTQIAGHVVVGDGAFLGGLTSVHQHVRIGTLALTGASARVARDVPPYTIAEGHPARLRGLNRVGLERAGFSAERRRRLARLVRRLFSGPRDPELVAVLTDDEDSAVRTLASFLAPSPRGITSARRR